MRTVQQLLTEGMGLTDEAAARPVLQTLDRLDQALEVLEERQNVR